MSSRRLPETTRSETRRRTANAPQRMGSMVCRRRANSRQDRSFAFEWNLARLYISLPRCIIAAWLLTIWAMQAYSPYSVREVDLLAPPDSAQILLDCYQVLCVSCVRLAIDS